MLDQETKHLALRILTAIGTPRALSVAILVRYEEWEQIAKLALNPVDYADSQSYFLDAQAFCLLKKAKFLPVKREELEKRAIEGWYACEQLCFATNRRVNPYLSGLGLIDEWLESYIRRVRGKIHEWIGARPGPLSRMDIRFGPGATMSDPSRSCTVPDKMTSRVTLTSGSIKFLPYFGRSAWGRCVSRRKDDLSLVRGNKHFTADKDASKRRNCAKEPSLNSAYQLPVGRQIRKRLKSRAKIDLDEGQALHQERARLASIDGEACTIDLSNASDCLASEVVRLLLPPAWFELLDSLRSPLTKVGGKWVLLEKFSSMGNGFTFELETLVFAAIICGLDDSLIAGSNVLVYGDDIIVPTQWSAAVLGALRWFGFEPNLKKTFVNGAFRESCGGDYFLGADVRPYYWKENLDDPHDFISLANGLRRAMSKIESPEVKGRLLRVWFGLLDRIPSHIRSCRGPEALGDLVIHDIAAKWDTRVRNSIRYVAVWRPAKYRKVLLDRFDHEVAMASLLYGVYLSGPEKVDELRYIVPRDGVLGYKRGWVPFS